MKKFWHIAKKVLLLSAVVVCLTLFTITLTSAINASNEIKCKGIKVNIDFDSGLAFVNEKEIIDRITFLSGSPVSDKKLMAIDFRTLETETEKNPYIANAELYVDGLHQIHVKVTQKRPVLRVLNHDGVGYYISENNERLPLHPNFTAHLQVVTGNVISTDMKRDSIVQLQAFELNNKIQKDAFLKSYIDVIEITTAGDFNLITKGNSPLVKFGKMDAEADIKLENLKIFCKEALTHVGWNKYSSINLKYKGQVVCEHPKAITTDSTETSNHL